MTAAPPRRAAAILFALFVIATGGAFFVTQRLNEFDPHASGQISLHAFGLLPWVGYAAAAAISVLAVRFASFSLAVVAMLVSIPYPHNHYWTWLLVPALGIWLPWLMDRIRPQIRSRAPLSRPITR